MTRRDDREPTDRDEAPLDLSPWAAPAPPRGLANRVMDAVRASAEVVEGPSTRPSASLRANGSTPARPRWRGIAIGLTAAAAAAAIAWAAWPRSRDDGPASGHVVAAAPSKITLGGGTVALLGPGADLAWTRGGGSIRVTHAAGDVTYQHPGPSRLVITTPYAEVQTASAWLHVEVPMSQRSKVAIAGVAGASVAAAVIIAVYEGKAEVREPTASPRVVEAGTQVAVAAPASPTRSPFTPVAKLTRDRAQRDALAAAIASARAARAAGVAGGGSGSAMPAGTALTTPPAPAGKVDLTPGELSKEEIRSSVREVIPLLTDCYVLMVEKYPRIGGKVVAKLVVEAEPDLGTIVTMQDDSEVAMKGAADGADPRDLQTDLGDFRQCLSATLETVALPPLGDKDGGRVEITYPFVFAPSEEEAEQYNEKKATPPDPVEPPVGKTAEELLAGSEDAAKRSQWPQALKLAEQAMRVDGVSRQTEARAAMVAALAACNTKNADKARRYFARATPSSKVLIEQRCLANKIDVTPGSGDSAGDMKNPFDGRQ